MITRKKLCAAVSSVLVLSSGALMATAAFAQEEAQSLDTVQVTGSRIKRVDAETSSPVFVMGREAIDRTGALTIGDFIQDIPAVAGAATNPAVNNGGGTGKATVSLRGLGDERTLILINGRRIVTNDVNAIPMSMVETVEVLKDGASAIYGSDAVGGVVNFILKSNFDGLEARLDYGISSRSDGQRAGGSMAWGASSDRGNIIISANYSDQEEVRASDRAFSYYALSLGSTSSTGVVQGGSSRAVTGRYTVPGLPCAQTLDPSKAGTSAGDFRCFNFSRDGFNYQAVGNLVLTPQERTGLFITGNFDLTDDVTAYVDAFSNKTRSAAQIAPLPFDGLSDGISLDKDNQYNVWGEQVDDIRLRLSRLGNRRYEYTTEVAQVNAGLSGVFKDSSWSWDISAGAGKIDQENDNQGYIDYNALKLALGPSQGGVCYTDGTFTTAIAGCTPIDFVGNFDPASAAGQAQLAALEAIGLDVLHRQTEKLQGFQANFSGDVLDMSAGTLQAAVGFEYRKSSLDFNPYPGAVIDPDAGYTCGISSELCTSPTDGDVTVKEVYGEALIPVSGSITASVGTRWSDYSTFGGTLNSKLGLEWRPSVQLLLRGTYAQVFRAPTITDLYGGETAASDGFTDPCNGQAMADNPACDNVPLLANPNLPMQNDPDAPNYNPGFSQTDTQLNAIKGGTDTLQPEEGESATFGFVYEPAWVEGFSTTVDFWQVNLDNAIGTIGTQNILDVCYASTAAAPSPFCALFSRRDSGEMEILFDKRANKGKVETAGVDIGLRYRTDTDFGRLRLNLDATYTDKYDVEVIYDGAVLQSQRNAGTFLSSANGGEGNYSQWRALGTLGWSKDIFDVSWTLRYIDGFTVGSLEPDGVCANRGLPKGSPGCQFSIGAYTYHNLQAGVKLDKLTVRVGIDNVNDKQPPILYQNNSLNGNTDERTYDTVGRYYWTNLTYSF